MKINVILIFNIIFCVAMLVYYVLFNVNLYKLNKINNYEKKFTNKPLLVFFHFSFAIALIMTSFIIIIFILIRVDVNNIANVWGYLYVIFAITNYIYICTALIIQTIFINNVMIVYKESLIIFLDEKIEYHNVVGIKVKKTCYILIYKLDSLDERKKIYFKKTCEFLQKL